MSNSHSGGAMAALLNTSRTAAVFRRRWLAEHHREQRAWGLSAARLTAREREVAVLIAHGLTNRQIAAELIIALRTADNHVQHIFDKAGVRTRSAATVWAFERHLVQAA